MKKIVFLGCLTIFLAPIVCAQEKIEAPIWNVGDKWIFAREGPMEVVDINKNGYMVKFSGGIFQKSLTGIAIFDKKTFNVLYILEGEQSKRYRGARKSILNFPLNIGKKWTAGYTRMTVGGFAQNDFYETFKVLGWEDVIVPAGKFKATKIEYKLNGSSKTGSFSGSFPESRAWYWYSPEIKYLLKCKLDKGYSEGPDDLGVREDWELTSFKLKK